MGILGALDFGLRAGSSIFDFFQGQGGSESVRQHENAAIQGAQNYGDIYRSDTQDLASGYRSQTDANRSAFTQDASNLWSNYWNSYQQGPTNGAMQQGAAGINQQQFADTRQALNEGGLYAARDYAQANLQQIPGVQQGFADARQQLGVAGQNIQADRSKVLSEYDSNKSLFRSDVDSATQQFEDIKSGLLNQRGSYDILTQTNQIGSQLTSALQELEQNKHNMTASEYMKQHTALVQQAGQAATSQVASVQEGLNKLYLEQSSSMYSSLNALKASVDSNITSMYGTMTQGVTNLDTASINVATAMMNSYQQEADTVNSYVQEAINAGTPIAAALGQVSTDAANRMYSALTADEATRFQALVQGPMSILETRLTDAQQSAANFTQMMFSSINGQADFQKLALDYQYSYNPAINFLTPYTNNIVAGIQDYQNQQFRQDQLDLQQSQYNSSQALGWAGLGLGAANTGILASTAKTAAPPAPTSTYGGVAGGAYYGPNTGYKK